MDKLEKNKQHRQQMHAAIVRAVETKLAQFATAREPTREACPRKRKPRSHSR